MPSYALTLRLQFAISAVVIETLPDNTYTPVVGIVIVVLEHVIPKFDTVVHVRSVVDDAKTLAMEF